MPGRAWEKAEEISKNRSLRILFFGWRGPLSVMGKNRFLQSLLLGQAPLFVQLDHSWFFKSIIPCKIRITSISWAAIVR
jgi:hypothetical protein